VRQAAGAANAAGRGGETALADLSPQLQEAADFSVNTSPEARAQFSAPIEQRGINQTQRFLDDVKGLAGDADAGAQSKLLVAARRAIENDPETGYDAIAKAAGPIQDKRLIPLLQHPAMQTAMKDAMTYSQMAGETGTQPTADVLNTARKALRDGANSAYRAGQGARGEAFKTVSKQLDAILRDNVPGFAEVQAKVASVKGQEAALQLASDITRQTDVRKLQALVADLAKNPKELAQFRYGLASGIIDELNATTNRGNGARNLLIASKDVEAKLQTAFGDEGTFQQFMKRVMVERKMEMTRAAFGNSKTASRLAAQDMGMPSPTLSPRTILSRVGDAVVGGKAAAVRDATAMAPYLLSQGGDIDKLLAAIRALARKQTVGPMTGAGIPAAGGLLFGRQ